MNLTDSSISKMSVDSVINELSTMYIKCIKNNVPFKKVPSVMLWGAPGLGKSQSVRQIKERIEKETNKKVNIIDLRLFLFNPVDLRGLPSLDKEHNQAVWLKPSFFNMDSSPSVVNILFLDEISSAPSSVQAAAYQLTLDRKVGEHELTENTIVICAGNRVSDNSVSYRMPKALANRLLHIEVNISFDSWKKWAFTHNINEKVISFLQYKPDFLFDEKFTDDNKLAFVTPRSWESVSNLLNIIDNNPNNIAGLISGIVGMPITNIFIKFDKIYDDFPSLEKIIKGKETKIPTRSDTLFGIVTTLVSYVKNHASKTDEVTNCVNYMTNLPMDFGMLFVHDLLLFGNEVKTELIKINEFNILMHKCGALLNVIDK